MRICFDFISPYAYVGWHAAKRLAAAHGRALEPVPVLFAAMLAHHGTLGPAEIPAKRAYVLRDAYRKARREGLSLAPPPAHPFHPLAALRAASVPMSLDDKVRLVDALYAATWGGTPEGESGPGVETPELVARIATEVGLDGASIVARAASDEVKRALRDATDDAIARGAFGVPTLFVDDEMFFGVDGIELAADHLAGGARVPADLDARWRALPAAAERNR